jgi:hypothetical protein
MASHCPASVSAAASRTARCVSASRPRQTSPLIVTMLMVTAYSMAVKWRSVSMSRAPAPPSPEESTASSWPDLSWGSASVNEIATGTAPAARNASTPLASAVRMRRPRSASAESTGLLAQIPAGGHGDWKSRTWLCAASTRS